MASASGSGAPLKRPFEERGQSGSIGLVLVFGMVIAGAVMIVSLGSVAISDTDDGLSTERAEKVLTQLDSKAALVALQNAETQQVSFQESGGAFEVENRTGSLQIEVENTTTGGTIQLLEEPLGEVRYTGDTTVLAYQGGGVWRSQPDSRSSVMVSPPEFHFRNGTLTLPVISVTGDRSLDGTATVGFNGSETVFPDGSITPGRNPLQDHRVTVTVRSEYYRGWGGYFETRTDGEVEYDHPANEVELTLVTPIGARRATAASSSLSASGSFHIQGSAKSGCGDDGDNENGGSEMYSNSYNSSEPGDYCDQAAADSLGDRGDIVYGGVVEIDDGSGGSWIHGNVSAGEDVNVSSSGSGKPSVYGHINYTDRCNPSVPDCQSRIEHPTGTVTQINGIKRANQINWYVRDTVDFVENNNDNVGAPISGGRLDYGGTSTVTLTQGRYFLERIDFSGGDTVVLEPNGGQIVLAVKGDIEIPEGAKIAVQGSGIVKTFVRGDSAFSDGDGWDVDLAKKSEITNAGDDATQFRLYGGDDLRVRLGDGGGGTDAPARFVGVLYAPPGKIGSGEIRLNKGELFGAGLTGTTTIANSGGSLHYDEALQTKQIIDRGAGVIKVTYLHVSHNRIRVDG